MSWNLIKSIQKETDLRLILPLGLNLRIGDVVSVGSDGGFTLEGTADSLLGLSPTMREGFNDGKVNFTTQSHAGIELRFRAAGEASTLFEELPKAKAGADIVFKIADAWVMAVTGRSVATISDTAEFRERILFAYDRNVWNPDWVLVNSIGTVDRITLLASRVKDTKVALEFAADVDVQGAAELSLTAGAKIVCFNTALTQCISTKPTTPFCSGIRVIDKIFSNRKTGTLGTVAPIPQDVMAAADEEFWEDGDTVIPARFPRNSSG